MATPVYLFTGFLEAGKTKFILETMNDEEFNDGKNKFLIIRCEEGEEEIYPDMLGDNVSYASFEEELPYVKMKFYKGKSKAQGNGIGLAVSDEIVKLHGGSLDIESTLGEGTAIIITLPVKETEPEE